MPNYYLTFRVFASIMGKIIHFTSQGEIPISFRYYLFNDSETYDLSDFNKHIANCSIPNKNIRFDFFVINPETGKKAKVRIDLKRFITPASDTIIEYPNASIDMTKHINDIL